jgi:uncharacterized protein YndB with AHSA1/START domain
MTTDLGTLTPRPDGRWELRYRRVLPHPPEKVWQALTEPEHLEVWFPSTIEGERVIGAPLTFRFDKVDDVVDGEVLAFEPPKLFELRWGEDILRFELHPTAEGTVLEMVDTITELGKAARDGAGWHECLDRLPDAITLAAPTVAWGARWNEVHPAYVDAFGPAAASIGPPEGHDPAYVDSTRADTAD